MGDSRALPSGSDTSSFPTPVLFSIVGAIGAIVTCSRSVECRRTVGGRGREEVVVPGRSGVVIGAFRIDDAEFEREREDDVRISSTSSSSSSESDPMTTLSLK